MTTEVKVRFQSMEGQLHEPYLEYGGFAVIVGTSLHTFATKCCFVATIGQQWLLQLFPKAPSPTLHSQSNSIRA